MLCSPSPAPLPALDHQRNRVLRVDLFVGVMSLCAVVSSMPAAYMGMNLQSGLEETPGLFWPVVQVRTQPGRMSWPVLALRVLALHSTARVSTPCRCTLPRTPHQTSLAVGALLAGSMWLYYRIGPQWRYARRMRDIDSLR